MEREESYLEDFEDEVDATYSKFSLECASGLQLEPEPPKADQYSEPVLPNTENGQVLPNTENGQVLPNTENNEDGKGEKLMQAKMSKRGTGTVTKKKQARKRPIKGIPL